MGIAKLFRFGDGFDEYQYHTIAQYQAGQLSGKQIEPWITTSNTPSLPKYANTSLIYFAAGKKSGSVIQMRVYEGRRAAYDFDWGHGHGRLSRE